MGDSFKDRELEPDLIIFSYEIFSFITARRFCDREYPLAKRAVEGSKFTEEIGKAAMVTWRKVVDSYRRKLSDDFPKYLDNKENFQRYFMHVAREIENSFDSSYFTEQLLRVTAFLLELCHYCFEKGHGKFYPEFVANWYTMFSAIFYERFESTFRWRTLHKDCLRISEKYDSEKIEKDLGRGSVELTTRYFSPRGSKVEEKSSKSGVFRKSVSRFHTIDRKTWKPILPENVLTRPRQIVLDSFKQVFSIPKKTIQYPLVVDLLKLAVAANVFRMLRKMKMPEEEINKYRRNHSKLKQEINRTLQTMDCAQIYDKSKLTTKHLIEVVKKKNNFVSLYNETYRKVVKNIVPKTYRKAKFQE